MLQFVYFILAIILAPTIFTFLLMGFLGVVDGTRSFLKSLLRVEVFFVLVAIYFVVSKCTQVRP